MSQNKNNTLAGLLLLATGLVVGAAGALFYHENQPKKANLVLKEVKEQFSYTFAVEDKVIHISTKKTI